MKKTKATGAYGQYLQRQIDRGANHERIIRNAPENSALGRLREIAEDIRDLRGISMSAAFSLAILENPKLYERYVEESALNG